MSSSIAVVGAGLAGAAATLCLSQRFPDVQVHWLDPGPLQPLPADAEIGPRVIACTPGSQSFLEELGAWQAMAPDRSQAYRTMRVWDRQGGASIAFRAADLHQTRLGTILEVSELLRALMKQIAGQINVRPWPESRVSGLTELQGEHRTLKLESGESLTCELVLGADGSRSALRELAGISVRVRPMEQIALVAVVVHSHPHQDTAWQAFGQHGPLAFLPLPDSADGHHQSAIVWSQDREIAEQHAGLADDALLAILESEIDVRLGPLLSIRDRASFPLNQLHARHYVQPGLCLVGDAIHTLHPLAGQGANLGFRDIAALTIELQRAEQRGVWMGHPSILRRFERSRKLDNLSMLVGMEAFRHGFGSRHVVLRWLCNIGMRQVDKRSGIKHFFARQAMH